MLRYLGRTYSSLWTSFIDTIEEGLRSDSIISILFSTGYKKAGWRDVSTLSCCKTIVKLVDKNNVLRLPSYRGGSSARVSKAPSLCRVYFWRTYSTGWTDRRGPLDSCHRTAESVTEIRCEGYTVPTQLCIWRYSYHMGPYVLLGRPKTVGSQCSFLTPFPDLLLLFVRSQNWENTCVLPVSFVPAHLPFDSSTQRKQGIR